MAGQNVEIQNVELKNVENVSEGFDQMNLTYLPILKETLNEKGKK